MDKNKEINDTFNHLITISDRKNIILTGIKKLNNFDENEFFFDSIMGQILIKGENLQLINMDTFQGKLTIKGKIISLTYFEENNKKIKAENIMARLFK